MVQVYSQLFSFTHIFLTALCYRSDHLIMRFMLKPAVKILRRQSGGIMVSLLSIILFRILKLLFFYFLVMENVR